MNGHSSAFGGISPILIAKPILINGHIYGGTVGTGAIRQQLFANSQGGTFKADIPIPIPVLMNLANFGFN